MILPLICHILHIASTCTSLGGLFYSRMVLLPNLKYIPENTREIYLSKMIKRFSYIKWTGVIVVAVTGIIQWFDVYPTVTNKTDYILAFTLKMVGAVGLFSITFLLALPNEKLKGMQRNRRFWSGLNIVCGLTILIGAALMRAVRNGEL
ncbi:MAG: hypothetical protein K0S12_2391 [Bacteroidetes bacterium]|jgi:uncharacterized membrane protein|nr:hypothetical protein [Bacteroidota bacterium]